MNTVSSPMAGNAAKSSAAKSRVAFRTKKNIESSRYGFLLTVFRNGGLESNSRCFVASLFLTEPGPYYGASAGSWPEIDRALASVEVFGTEIR